MSFIVPSAQKSLLFIIIFTKYENIKTLKISVKKLYFSYEQFLAVEKVSTDWA